MTPKLQVSLIFLIFFLPLVSADAIPPFAVLRLSSESAEARYVEALTCESESFTPPEFFYAEEMPDFRVNIPDPKGCFWKRSSEVILCVKSRCEIYRGVPYGEEFKFAIHFADKTLITESQKAVIGRNEYYIDISKASAQDNIPVISITKARSEPSVGFFTSLFFALIVTISLELLVAWIYVQFKNLHRALLRSVVYANLITVPIVSLSVFAATILPIDALVTLLFAELFAVVFEAFFMRRLNKKLSLNQAFFLSILMNSISFFLGGILLFVILMPLGV